MRRNTNVAELHEKEIESVSGGAMEVDGATAEALGAPQVRADGTCAHFDREDGSEATCAHCAHAVVSSGRYYCLHYKNQ